MTSLVGSVSVLEESKSVILDTHKSRHVLKSKESTSHKCKKVLRRKLKKYKLRHGDTEDQDVLDMSETLLSSLRIKSPNNTQSYVDVNSKGETEDIKPKNYLCKMVRSKQNIQILENCESSNIEVNVMNEKEDGHISIQEKKQMDAFKLLMDSRNKSLGSNSPGKEKPADDFETQKIIDKKIIKAKRHLILQKMAEAKGSTKKKEIENYQEKLIKRKMEKRAEKLRNMILNKDVKSTQKDIPKHSSPNHESILNNNESNTNVEKPLKTLQLVNIFSDINEKSNNIKSEKAHMPNEDEEFFKKLSPSLRKKESMLCYLKKLDKVPDCAPHVETENDNHVIKVKLPSKSRSKKGKKQKLNLNKEILDSCNLSIVHIESTDSEVVSQDLNVMSNNNSNNDHRKRKRDFKDSSCDTVCFSNDPTINVPGRPRRSVKKPIKYTDKAYISSSDEELHIFTPRKKKHIDDTSDQKSITKLKPNGDVHDSEKLSNAKKKSVKDINLEKKPVKLAPIFASKVQSTAAIEAKHKFLQSGVPDQLKKMIAKQKNENTLVIGFPKVVHVQQIETLKTSELNYPCLNFHNICSDDEIHSINLESNSLNNLLNLSLPQYTAATTPQHHRNSLMVLKNIKQMQPKFPVYRTYRLLKDKKKGDFNDFKNVNFDNSVEILNGTTDIYNENPDQLSWTDKYKGMSTSQIVGNFDSVKEMRKWLVSWTENESKSKKNRPIDSDSSDFYHSDADSRDSGRTSNNLLIVTGPVGSGKTSSVYAVASDLAIKVIEVNASSKRSGKIMLQDLQEATQSHKVNRGSGSADNSQKSQETMKSRSKKVSKRGRPKKVVEDIIHPLNIDKSGISDSQENSRTGMSLILIDDADIVFDQDDGFCSALVQLVYSSKRPVIVITTSLTCPHLQRFLQCAKVIKMLPLLPRMLGTWLDIMCLADNGICWPGAGAKFLNYFKGDMRKTINCLQFYVSTQELLCSLDEPEPDLQSIDCLQSNTDEANSSTSWAHGDTFENNVLEDTNFDLCSVWNNFINEQLRLLHFGYPLEVFNIWWSIPQLLSTASDCNGKSQAVMDGRAKKSKSLTEMEALCNAIDTFSVSDYFSHNIPEQKINITSKPWYTSESHSVSEQEDLNNFVKNYEITDEISHEIIKHSIVIAQKVLGCDSNTEIHFPDMTVQRERDRVISRHKHLTSYLNQSAVLDRKALALDYWSSCRTICRTEKAKTDNNCKRNNRFCHYLKSLSVLCKNDMFDTLGSSLSSSGNS